MAKKLKMVFKDDLDYTKTLSPSIAAENLDAEVVQNSMNAIAALGIFEKDSVQKYVTPVSAHYTETITTPIF